MLAEGGVARKQDLGSQLLHRPSATQEAGSYRGDGPPNLKTSLRLGLPHEARTPFCAFYSFSTTSHVFVRILRNIRSRTTMRHVALQPIHQR